MKKYRIYFKDGLWHCEKEGLTGTGYTLRQAVKCWWDATFVRRCHARIVKTKTWF